MFSFNIIEQDEKLKVSLVGDLDIEATEIVEDELSFQLQDTSGQVELDFQQIDFVDSSGIGLLITIISILKESNRNPTIINLNEDVKQVFQLLQLEEIFGKGVLVA
nr:STAS domain-containing protein [Lysinibacillus timonensis]